MPLRLFLFFAFVLLLPAAGLCQRLDSLTYHDSIQRSNMREQSDYLNQRDTVRSNPLFYERAKKASKRNRFLGGIYRFLFREPTNPLQVKKKQVDNRDRKYKRFNKRIIRRVIIMPLDVFGPKVFDTLAITKNFLERAGNAVHHTTRRSVVQSQLSFKAGERFNTTLISNNERILRETPYIVDARIVPVMMGWKDSIDILVITQDIFSLNVGGGVGGVDQFDFEMQDINLLGYNHTARFRYRFDNSPGLGLAKHRTQLYYLVPYLTRKSFVSAEAEAWQGDQHLDLARVRVFKNFLFTTTRWAGAGEVARVRFSPPRLASDTAIFKPVVLGFFDGWLGRSFRINSGNTVLDERVRLIMSGRLLVQRFVERPELLIDSNQLFRDRELFLLSFGYSDRDYFRDALINGYGRTEDVPLGASFTATLGVERNTFSNRNYAGLRFNQARYYADFGYLYFLAEMGSFINYTRPEQGALRGEVFYYSPIAEQGKVRGRHFIRVRYAQGVNRYQNEFFNINNERGIRGISNDAFAGLKSLVLNYETVFFLNFDILSFKVAPFTTVDAGWVSFSTPLFKRLPFVSLGAGLRLYNERLTIRTFQFRINYYIGVPELPNPLRTNFALGQPIRLTDFSINQPQTIGLE